ncbi:MAG: PAS domain S-box protein [Rhodospirillaceae bacterium]|jgi:two-component system, cell cycle sensor histidine kinase PleC|nr:PAS domain S-box protein [Rhodospirillaceae bacterium]MBT5080152.1 PAS domain S-box protein [Rhodospirillaceae bacterium]MBT7286099.1 PAS domain S-box protein [Rhodospirillaceae bacterium]
MSAILLISILVRVLAFGAALLLIRRIRDWRLTFLAAMIGFMAVRQTWTLATRSTDWQLMYIGSLDELPGLLVSVLALMAVFFLKDLLAENRRALSDVGESEKRNSSIIDSLDETYYRTGKDGRIIVASPSARDLLGYSVEELIGYPLGDFYADPSEREVFLEALNANGGRIRDFESRLKRKDGTEIWVRTNAHFVHDDDGQISGVEGVTRDVSDRKKAEQTIEHALAEAQAANKSKSEFLANMSHELRTPLNAIIGFADVMKSEIFGPLGSNRYKSYMKDIQDSGQHLLAIINDILDLARVDSGHVELQESEIDLAELLELCRRMFTVQARNKNFEFTVQSMETPIRLLGDQRLLQQVIINLISNAVKFTPSGGSITVAAEKTEGNDLVIRIRDSGIGMSAEEMKTIFEPFRQVDSSLTRRYDGTGLGLSLSKGLTELHNGMIQFESALGEGTTVTVLLPANRVLDASPNTSSNLPLQ